MRTRHSTGGVRKQRGRWLGLWYENGIKKSSVVGFVKDMTKGEAREAVAEIVKRVRRDASGVMTFGAFVEGPYFDFYGRKWKPSTAENTKQRIRTHLVSAFKDRELSSFKRDGLQDSLDAKGPTLSFSVVDHLRWDLRQIFAMAIAEGHIRLNPAALLFTPKDAVKPVRRAMTIQEVQLLFSVLGQRERLIAKFAVLIGMRPGEIFGLTWGVLTATYADVRQRVYRGLVDTPKTNQSLRHAALSEGLLLEIEAWRSMSLDCADSAWVFPSEALSTPISKDNCWRRSMLPKLTAADLNWCNFQVMRRTHATLMKAMGADGKLCADQLGHSLDTNQNVYTQSSVETRRVLVNQLESKLVVQ